MIFFKIFFFILRGICSSTLRFSTLLHHDHAAHQEHCGRCRIRTRDLCSRSLVRYQWATTSPNSFHNTLFQSKTYKSYFCAHAWNIVELHKKRKSYFQIKVERRWTIIALRNLIFYFWSNIELTWHECSFMPQITNYKEKIMKFLFEDILGPIKIGLIFVNFVIL